MNVTALLGESRDRLIDGINIIEAHESQHFSNDMEREQALDSFCAWARDFVGRATAALKEQP
jgi:hypothetical protein